MIPTLDSGRVRLRPHRADDRDAVFAQFSDASVTRYWGFPTWTSLDEADAYLAPLIVPPPDPPVDYNWVIADPTTDAFIGTTTLFKVRRDQQRAEIGYSLVPSRQGQGLARTAVSRALRFAFDELALRRIEADVDPRNAPSIALLEKLGFSREGYMRERWNVNGELADTVFLGLLAREVIYASDA